MFLFLTILTVLAGVAFVGINILSLCLSHHFAEKICGKHTVAPEFNYVGATAIGIIVLTLLFTISLGYVMYQNGYRSCVEDTAKGRPSWVRSERDSDAYVWEHVTYSNRDVKLDTDSSSDGE